MNVLVLGAGGREHAIAWKISQSALLNKLYVASGNAGTSRVAENIQLNPTDFNAIAGFIIEKAIDLLIVGPEDPLVNGITEKLRQIKGLENLKIIGPDSKGAKLEGSKEFAKIFMQKNNIPTALYKAFTKSSINEAYDFIDSLDPPYVLKADGLAAGKGVLIMENKQEAKNSLAEMLDGKFGQASHTVVIEEFLDGIEYSVFVLTDGENYVILPEAKDYKRIGEGDTGLNTGGMGAISPVPFFNNELKEKTEQQIIIPTICGLKSEGIDYKGFIFFGLIKVGNNPYVIEYNVRLGDPESEAIIPRINSDFLDLLNATAEKRLHEKQIKISDQAVAAVMAVSGGYPEAYEKGKIINGCEDIKDSILFHAGTKIENNNIITSGGRVIAVCSYGNNINDALLKSYNSLQKINFENMYYRKDLGFDLK